MACATRAFTRRRCVRRRGRRCSAGATITRSAWAASRRSRRRRPATARCGRTRWRRCRRFFGSTATRRRSSASATRCRCGKRARSDRSIAGRRARGSNTSTASSRAKRISGIPSIHEGTKLVEPPKTPEEGYHFMEDMTDRAIAWVRQQRLLAGDKPFFMYFAPGATHAPHHVPKEWADKYKGKFDQGWDKLREETFARQKKLGVIPAGLRANEAARRDSRVGSPDAGIQARAGPRDGSLRGILRVRRSPHRPADRRARSDQGARQHADLLHHRRQRSVGRRHAPGHLQRNASRSTV